MSGVSLPVTRPTGRALVVGNAGGRVDALGTLQRMGYGCTEADDPYAAMAELCRRPMVYRAVILSLVSLHREELAFIPGIKRRFPHLEVWLTHTDGRQSALAESMRLGADGLLSGEGLHRVAMPAGGTMGYATGPSLEPPAPPPAPREAAVHGDAAVDGGDEEHAENQRTQDPGDGAAMAQPGSAGGEVEPNAIGEPVLTVDELRALLQEQPAPPPAANGD